MEKWKPDAYCLELSAEPERSVAETIFDRVWRFDFSAPGFCLLDLRSGVDSHTLRSWMVRMKELLSEVGVRRGRLPFAYRSMGRFDQQETTKFHQDGAPEQSLLLLGYEPTKVLSRLFLADFIQAAFDLGITAQQFLQDLNPMYRRGEEILGRYVTELPPPVSSQYRILLVNNSSLPFTEARTNPLGVMHKAEIINSSQSERRIVNSTMLVVAETDEIGPAQQWEFVATETISQKTYY